MIEKTILFLFLLTINSCSPGYVMRAAYEHAKILSRREPISDLLEDPRVSAEEKRKLALVQEARVYAKLIGLSLDNSFTKYAKIDGDVLSWILVASKPDAFNLYTWWFPFVGSVPYKGFFEHDEAKAAAAALKEAGYETSIREAAAFSTLGWFDDPILSTTLKHDEVTLVNTVLHESVHTTFWLSGHVDFNESVANFIGTVAACDFFKSRLAACRADDAACQKENKAFVKTCATEQGQEFELARIIVGLFNDLDALYKSKKSYDEKLFEREVIFNKHLDPLRRKYPNMKALRAINNAEIIGLTLYLGGLSEVDELYKRKDRDFAELLKTLEANKKSLKMTSAPLNELKNLK